MSDKKRLVEIINRFENVCADVVGDVMLDTYSIGPVLRLNPERPSRPVLKITGREHIPGGAANVASNVASLGANAYLFGRIGDDSAGGLLKEACLKRGIKLFPFLKGNTTVKERFVEKEHGDYIMRADTEDDLSANPEDFAELERAVRANGKPHVLILSDYNKGLFRGRLGRHLIDWANHSSKISVVDPKPANAIYFKKATLVRPNLKEARQILGSNEEDLEVLTCTLKERMQSKYAAITCGAQGMVTYDGGFHRIGTKARQVADVTGAGDTVVATMALSLACGASIVEAGTIANYAAGIVVEKSGTATTTREELIRRILEDK